RMSSEESKDNLRLFIKYEHDENTRGPYNERQLLDICMQKEFDDSTPFCLMKEGEEPNNDTPFLTYAQRSMEGVPFSFVNAVPSEKNQIYEGLNTIQEDQSVQELHVEPEFQAAPFVDAYLVICDFFREKEKYLDQATLDYLIGIEAAFTDLTTAQKELVLKELEQKIAMMQFLFCSFCDRFMFTPHQTFMHMIDGDHIEKTINSSKIFEKASKLMDIMIGAKPGENMEYEYTRQEKQMEGWTSESPKDKNLRPVGNELEGVRRREEVVNCNREKTNFEVAEIWINQLQYESEEWMKLLIKRIGKAKTRCTSCKLIFGCAGEYYHHLLTYLHMEEADPDDIITVVVNVEMRRRAIKDLSRQPRPEIPSQPPAPVTQKDENPESREPNQPPKVETEDITAEKKEQSADGGSTG
ncbi:hypothetical protein PMAYCL1PPCAC_00573, partial [Pristionchus mayeri]